MKSTLIFFLHGLTYAGLLFLVSSGLTLVFGMMNVLNFAHATFYMLGAYFSWTLLRTTNNFWLSLVVAPALLFCIGALVERFLLRRVHVLGHVHELLLTFGLAYVLTELVKWIWGTHPLAVPITGFLAQSVDLFGITYPVYRLFVFSAAILVGVLMALVLYKTRVGIIIRGAVDDSDIVGALGINVPVALHGHIWLWSGTIRFCRRHCRPAAYNISRHGRCHPGRCFCGDCGWRSRESWRCGYRLAHHR